MSGGAKKSERSTKFGRILSLALVGTLWMAAACGSGGSNSASQAASSGGAPTGTGGSGGNTIAAPAPNVASLTVNSGPNFLFTTVTVCAPGTSTCATIPNVLVDTGSYGLRILASPHGATGPAVASLGLPQVNAPNSLPLLECVTFLDNSFVWGPVQRADVIMAGETAGNIPVQIIGDPHFLNDVPDDCSGKIATNNENSFETLGANGILGIGLLVEDCGRACAPPNTAVPKAYYACAAGGPGTCQGYLNGDPRNATSVPVVNQVSNPIASFAQDNNGTIIQLPAVPAGGQASVSGSLVFGIGTQANNGLGNATVLTAVASGHGFGSSQVGTFTTQFGGQAFPDSFIDSGSNGFYFLDSSALASLLGGNPLPPCPQSGAFSNDPSITSFYCGTLNSSATNVGTNGNSTVVHIGIANAETEFMSNRQVFNNVAGPNPGSFDWGMPFFFGRSVYTAIEGVTPPSGVPAGPFWAY
jgi:hypothetical protein